MKSTIFSSVLLSSVLGCLASQQAEARMTPNMVDRSLSDLANIRDGHLHILTKRNDEAAISNSHKKHRRHHSRKEKRGACSSSSSKSSSSSADNSDDSDSVSTGSTPTRNAVGQNSNSNSDSDSGSDSGYGSSSSSAAASAPTPKNKSKSNSGSSSGSSSSSSSSGSSSPGSDSSDNSSSSDSSSSSSGRSSSSATGSSSSLGSITGFQGTNSGIGSWFRTDSSQDSTNGRSWCQLNYQDSWMGFAPSVGTMLSNFGDSTNTAGKAYCGREAKATNPSNGKTALIYIVDGFDDKWVKTPGSIDLTLAAFEALYGSSPNGDKNTVIMNLQWEFTGNVNEQYTFNAGGK